MRALGWPSLAALALVATACTSILGVTDVPDDGTYSDDSGAGVDGADAPDASANAPDDALAIPPGPCTPGATQCSGTAQLRCLDNGTWVVAQACPYVCAAGSCTGTCAPASHQCAGNVPQTCDANGRWQSGAPCASACTNGACAGSCTPGATRCSGTTAQKCDANGAWQTSSVCPYACVNGACTGYCSPASTKCASQNGGFQPQVCDSSGQFVNNGPMCCGNCANGACQPGACASSCARVPSYDSMCVSIYGSNTYVYYFQCNGTCGSQGPALGLLSTGHCTTGAIGAGRTNSLPAGGWCAACDQQC